MPTKAETSILADSTNIKAQKKYEPKKATVFHNITGLNLRRYRCSSSQKLRNGWQRLLK
jgi:hypothetical protein